MHALRVAPLGKIVMADLFTICRGPAVVIIDLPSAEIAKTINGLLAEVKDGFQVQ